MYNTTNDNKKPIEDGFEEILDLTAEERKELLEMWKSLAL